MKKTIKVLKIVLIVLLSLIFIINISIMVQSKINPDKVPTILGYKPFIVSSGSMEGEMNVGDLVFVRYTDPANLKVDDIIAFKDKGNTVTTHRIVEEIEVENERCFKTKGDNNTKEDDGVVCTNQIEGRLVGKIPKIGSVLLFIQEPLGFAVLMLSLIIICILIYFTSIKKDNNKLSDEELKEFEEFKKAKLEKKEKKSNKKKTN